MKSNSIKDKTDIERIKQYMINNINSTHSLEWDKQLLFFILGINTCYKCDELLSLKWCDIFNYDAMELCDYIIYEGYKFYFNKSCKEALYTYIEKYNRQDIDIYVFTSRSYKDRYITNEAVNKVYRAIQKELDLPFNFSTMSLRKTFAYWQIQECKRDYVKMSKLKRLLHSMTIGNDINIFAEYNINDDMIYINDVNL